MNTILPFDKIENFTFNARPVDVPADLRTERKIAQILLVLDKSSYRGKSSILKLQLFNWAFTTEEAMERLKRYILLNEQFYRPDVIHLDPAVNRAIRFAKAEGLVGFDGSGKVVISDQGKFLVNVIDNNEVMEREKANLKELGKKITEAKIEAIIQDLF